MHFIVKRAALSCPPPKAALLCATCRSHTCVVGRCGEGELQPHCADQPRSSTNANALSSVGTVAVDSKAT